MSKSCKTYHEYCLYFTANSLSRKINEIADESFKITGLAPSYAYLMMILFEEPGLTQNELSERMNLKASTMTRFIEKLVQKKFVERIQEGRSVMIYPTQAGKELKNLIHKALKDLHKKYTEILGEDFASKLTANIHQASEMLKE